MAVVIIKKDIVMDVHNGCSWYSAGQGITGKIVCDDGGFISFVNGDGEQTLPKEAIEIIKNPAVLALSPPRRCDHCGKRHPRYSSGRAVWKVLNKFVCNLCWAAYYHSMFPLERYELDPETKRWSKTADLVTN